MGGLFTPREDPLPEPFSSSEPIVVGLLGGVASGKSTVARAIGAHGLRVIDADEKARQAASDPGIRARLADRFGPEVLAADGELDRKELARRIFGDDGARRDAEEILHPAIRTAIQAELEESLRAGVSVVLDVPLLLERGLIEVCDLCIFVDASESCRRDRARGRGWQSDELARREAAQAPLSVKKDRCAYTISTDGPLTDSAPKVAALLRRISTSHNGD